MHKFLLMTLISTFLAIGQEAAIIRDYRYMDPYSDYPSATRYRTYSTDDPRFNNRLNPYYRDPLYNYDAFPDSHSINRTYEENRRR